MSDCGGCNKPIEGKYLIVGKEHLHAGCFTCSGCSTDLQGKTAVRRNGKFVCADCAGGNTCQRCRGAIKIGERDIEVGGLHFHEATCLLCAEPDCRAPIPKDQLYISPRNALRDIHCKNHTIA